MSKPDYYVSMDEGFFKCDLFDRSDDREEYIHSDPDEAIEAALDDWLSPKCNVLEHLMTAVGETLTIHGFTRRKIDVSDPDPELILEDILERLDEEYGGGDEFTKPTQAMKIAAEKFVKVIQREYEVWQVEPTHKAVVDVDAWVHAERPDWLEPQEQGTEAEREK